MSDEKPSYLKLPDGGYIAYHRYVSRAKSNFDSPSIIFCGGFKSDMNGAKALFLGEYCRKNDISYTRFDYTGHGQSSGKFTDGTIGRWKNDALAVLDNTAASPQIIIGSSMGGWIMLLIALARPDKIKALVGIASAPDFTENLIWDKLTETERENLIKTGVYEQPSAYCHDPAGNCDPYPITYKLITEARNHLLLNSKIGISCPARLIHGMNDEDVPYETSLKLADLLSSNDVHVTLTKSGRHRMSDPEDLAIIEEVVAGITK